MKITVINKKKPIRKPTNYCPWMIDDPMDGGPDKR
jgi:hypothetical protein